MWHRCSEEQRRLSSASELRSSAVGANGGLEENGAVWAVCFSLRDSQRGVETTPGRARKLRDGVVAAGMILLPFALNAMGIGGRLEGTGFNTLFALVIAFVGYWAMVSSRTCSEPRSSPSRETPCRRSGSGTKAIKRV